MQANKLVERVARLLCEMDGTDPDLNTIRTGAIHKEVDGMGFSSVYNEDYPVLPAWQQYIHRAKFVFQNLSDAEEGEFEKFGNPRHVHGEFIRICRAIYADQDDLDIPF